MCMAFASCSGALTPAQRANILTVPLNVSSRSHCVGLLSAECLLMAQEMQVPKQVPAIMADSCM